MRVVNNLMIKNRRKIVVLTKKGRDSRIKKNRIEKKGSTWDGRKRSGENKKRENCEKNYRRRLSSSRAEVRREANSEVSKIMRSRLQVSAFCPERATP